LFFVLPCYFLFFLVVPLILTQLAAGRRRLVLAVMAALFVAAQWNVFTPPMQPSRLITGYFNLAGWQAVFFGGLILGNWRELPAQWMLRSRRWLLPCVATVSVLFVLRHLRSAVGAPAFLQTSPAVDMRTPGWLTVLNFAVVVLLCSLLSDNARHWLSETWAGRGLGFLGVHSLQVFVWHMALWMLLRPFMTPLSHQSGIVQTVIGILAVGTLFIPAYLRSRYLVHRVRVQRNPRIVAA
jgi:hypothetical protein